MAGKDPASQQVTLFRAAAGADHPRSPEAHPRHRDEVGDVRRNAAAPPAADEE
jgi:hypothetical protein